MSPLRIPLMVHASHEAGVKLGGIGAVLDGLLSSPAYLATVERTLLVGPVNVHNHGEMDRLLAPSNHLTIVYSSIHGINHAPEPLLAALRGIEQRMHVRLLYGKRRFGSAEHEVILVDTLEIAPDVVKQFKYHVWNRWNLDSARYESQWEFSYFMDSAEPLFAALEAVTADLAPGCARVLMAHEWLGLPLVFAAALRGPGRYRTIFYAHEVATARMLVENDDGHDTRFYNALRMGLARGHSLDEVFGDQSGYFKHALLQRAGVCDAILAVGDLVVDELRFLGGVFGSVPVDLAYNGLPAGQLTYEERLDARRLMLDYAENVLGYRPDYIFTHVGRMVLSKAFWRDFRVLEHLDAMLAARGQRAALFTVATADPTGRLPADVYRWESEYGWPVGHRSDTGDLRDGEVRFFHDVQEPFNWRGRAIRAVLVNQFGWSRERCGLRMPEEMSFAHLRAGTDLEFGQSIYEPFGIAQVEPLAAGALTVVSNVCGCTGFIGKAGGGYPGLIVADYVTLPTGWLVWSPWDALWIDRPLRDAIESQNSYTVAQSILERLPQTDAESRLLFQAGQNVARAMSWDVVVRDYLLPPLQRVADCP